VFPGEGESPVRMTETVLDSWWFFQSIFGHDQAVPVDRIRLAYLSLLGQPAQFRWQ
jgi:hypothetical protein